MTKEAPHAIAIWPENGPVQEPPLGDAQFLKGFIEYGVWLRVAGAFQQARIIKDSGSSSIELMAALALLYELAGKQYEDFAANVVAWTLWSRARTVPLADVLERLIIHSVRPSPTSGYVAQVHEKFRSRPDARLRVDAYSYLREIQSTGPTALIEAIGIRWHANPSVKQVPPRLREAWASLPEDVAHVLRSVEPDVEVFSDAYNKIKHGPQLAFMSIRSAIVARGIELSPQSPYVDDDTSGCRVLRGGSRLQETQEEERRRVSCAPFLIGAAANCEKTCTQLRLVAQVLRALAIFLYNGSWKGVHEHFEIQDHGLHRMFGDPDSLRF